MTGAPAEPDFGALQAIVDAAPNGLIRLAPGDYLIDRALRISRHGTTLAGPARIIQTNPAEPIIEIYREGAVLSGVRIEGLTLTRSPGTQETSRHAVLASECRDLDIVEVQVHDNWSTAAAIQLQRCESSRVAGCSVVNYKRIGVDDRTESDLYGYAFRVIDGTGIGVKQSTGLLLHNNRIVERRLFPTPETKQQHHLGEFTAGARPLNKGRLAPPGDYANNWHQGSALLVTSPLETSHVTITGNYIENAAQGIDIHADHITCSHNTIRYAFIGIKCMHGSRNVIISDNNVSHNDLWGLVMLPGTASHPAQPSQDDSPARPANLTTANIIANNIFSDFGFGYEYHNWEGARGGVISLESGQLPENPIMTDIIVKGNIVYDTGKDAVLVDGAPRTLPPRYEFAVFITPEPSPQRLHFSDNIFHPGRAGVSNMPLEP